MPILIGASLLLLLPQAIRPGQSPGDASVPIPPWMAEPVYRGYPAQDALSYGIQLEVLSDGSYRGLVEYRFAAVEAIDSIQLDHIPSKDWALQFRDMEGQPLPVVHGEHSVMVQLGRRLESGETCTFQLDFGGKPADGLYRKRNRYGETYVFSDHFTARARGWLPCEDANADRASFTLELSLPPGWIALGCGDWKRLAAEEGNSAVRYRGETRSDIPPSLLAFTAGPYLEFTEEGDERLVPHAIFPQDRKQAAVALKHHAQWMEIMETTFGPYLYAKYAVAQVPTRWGGMEYPGNVWIAQNLFDYEHHGVGTLAHEFAHMWFGDGVGYAQWEDAWLSEGFATYFGPWLAEQSGVSSLKENLSHGRDRWRKSTRARRLPIRWKDYKRPDDFFGRASANTYSKGSWVLHMLRQEVGDEAFFAGIRSFYLDRAGQAVDSAGFQAAMEKASGQDLDGFFRQWLDRPDAPWLSASLGEQGRLTVRQVQEAEPFRFHLRVAWVDVQGQPQTRRFEVQDRETILELGAGSTDLTLDPDEELLYIEG